MKKDDVVRCDKDVWGDRGSSWRCQRKGVLQENDTNGNLKNWCKQHAPSTQVAKDKEWRIRFNAKQAEDMRRYSRRQAEWDLMQAIVKIDTQLLPKELLKPIDDWLNNGGLAK